MHIFLGNSPRWLNLIQFKSRKPALHCSLTRSDVADKCTYQRPIAISHAACWNLGSKSSTLRMNCNSIMKAFIKVWGSCLGLDWFHHTFLKNISSSFLKTCNQRREAAKLCWKFWPAPAITSAFQRLWLELSQKKFYSLRIILLSTNHAWAFYQPCILIDKSH